MKTKLLKAFAAAAGVLTAGLCAQGAPLQRADLPGQPAWVVHVDVDGLRPTALGKFLQSQMETPAAQAKLAAFAAIFSFDPRTQLHGLTLYSSGPTPEDGVLVVYADFDAAKLLTLARAAKGYEDMPYKGHTLHSWLEEKKHNKEGEHPRVYATIQGKRVIFGQRASSVSRALDVLDGTMPTLAASGLFPELGAAGDTSFIEAAGRKLDLGNANPSAALFRLSKEGLLQVNEAQGQVRARLTLQANDEEVAGHMSSIGQGLLGLLKLQEGKPELAKLADSLTVKQDGARVVGTLSLPASEVVDMLRAQAARHAARRAQAGSEPEK